MGLFVNTSGVSGNGSVTIDTLEDGNTNDLWLDPVPADLFRTQENAPQVRETIPSAVGFEVIGELALSFLFFGRSCCDCSTFAT